MYRVITKYIVTRSLLSQKLLLSTYYILKAKVASVTPYVIVQKIVLKVCIKVTVKLFMFQKSI